jgi:hypothetical protein
MHEGYDRFANLLPLPEWRRTPAKRIRYAAALERIFQCLALVIASVEHGYVGVLSRLFPFDHLHLLSDSPSDGPGLCPKESVQG